MAAHPASNGSARALEEADALKIFISYRRSDSQGITDSIAKYLQRKYGKNSVFRDIDLIYPATDFRKEIAKAIDRCKVFICIIDKTWVSVSDAQGRRKLDSAEDYVRTEIEALAFAALYYDQADLVMGHRPSFYDLLAYERVKSFDPTEITAVTGSFDVGGWVVSKAPVARQEFVHEQSVDARCELDVSRRSSQVGFWKAIGTVGLALAFTVG